MDPGEGGQEQGARVGEARSGVCTRMRHDALSRGEMGFYAEPAPHSGPPRFRGTWFAPPRGLCVFHGALAALFLLLSALSLADGGVRSLIVASPIAVWAALHAGMALSLAHQRRELVRCVSLTAVAEATGEPPTDLERRLAEAGVRPHAVVNDVPAYLAAEAAPALALLRPSGASHALLRASCPSHALLRASCPSHARLRASAPLGEAAETRPEGSPARLTTCTCAHRYGAEA